jgi:hypothetical protein
VIVPPITPGEAVEPDISDDDVVNLFGQITDSRSFGTKRDVAREVGERLGLSAKQVYGIMERHKLVE